jgi:hypothetical protein
VGSTDGSIAVPLCGAADPKLNRPGFPRASGNPWAVHRIIGTGVTIDPSDTLGTILVLFDQSVTAGTSCVLTRNAVRNNGLYGISAASGSVVVENTLSGNTGWGLQFNSAYSGYGNNVLTENNGGSANVQLNVGTELSTNICSFDTTCP